MPYIVIRQTRMGQLQPASFPYQHETELSARIECERLARLNPGERFTYWVRLGTASKTDVAWQHDTVQIDMPF